MLLSRAALLVLVFAVAPAAAQTPKGQKAPAGPEVRYFTSLDGWMDGNADVVLKEVRQGRTLTAASLDVCYPAEKGSDRNDRFVLDLAINGQNLTGTTQSLTDKKPVDVSLTRRPGSDTTAFAGRVTIGGKTQEIISNDNADISEKDYRESQDSDDSIAKNPKDFAEVSPEIVAARVQLAAAGGFIAALRGEPVELSASSLAVSCQALRSGSTTIYLNVDPLRAAALVARVRALPGVVAAGWSGGVMDIDRTVRFASAPYRDGEKIARDRIAAAAADVLAGAYGATVERKEFNERSGKLTLTFARPNRAFPALGLTDILDVSGFLAPEKPGSDDKLLLWISGPTSTTRDDHAGPKLAFGDSVAGDEDSDLRGDSNVVDALATALKGQRWDADRSEWK